MHVSTLRHDPVLGWSSELLPCHQQPGTLALAFADPRSPKALSALADIQHQLPHAIWIGGSTAGELSGGELHDGTVVVALTSFERSSVFATHADLPMHADAQAVGQGVARQLLAQAGVDPLRGVFLLGAGRHVDSQAVLDGLTQALPEGVAVAGGLAADGTHFESPWTLTAEGRRSDHLCAVGLAGDSLRMATACATGWRPFGPSRRISRSDGNVLLELDGRPALDLYRRYLGALAAELPGSALHFPLQVTAMAQGQSVAVVRTILAIDEQRGGLVFASRVPEGGAARLMQASRAELLDSVATAAHGLFGAWPADLPALTTIVSCVGRRLVLGMGIEEELQALLHAAPPGSHQVGFCSYGEMAAGSAGQPTALHNQSVALMAWGESA